MRSQDCPIELAFGWCWHTDRMHADPVATDGTFTLESERVRPVPMWRRRAIDPDAEGVSARFRFAAVDMTGRLVVRP